MGALIAGRAAPPATAAAAPAIGAQLGGSARLDDAPASGRARRDVRRRLLLAGLGCSATYLALALLAFWPVQPFSTTSVVGCGCYDPAEQMWFLAWTPHAILHGLNPFFTNALNVPDGVNLAVNTTMPLLGVLAAPLTLTLGPVAAFNVLIRLAFCTSALSMYLLLRHWRLRWPVAFLGGLVYGFSPYMFAQASLHLNLCFVPLLPLLVLAVEQLVAGAPRWSARRAGLVLGGLATAQYFVSSELLAGFGLLAAVAVVLLTLRFPRRASASAGRVLAGLGFALVPFAALAGYPIVFSLVGSQHVITVGSFVQGFELIANDLLSPIVPTPAELIAPAHWAAVGATLVGGDAAENGGYLGIPLVACFLAGASWAVVRRHYRGALLALLALVAFLLSLGQQLVVHARATRISLPFGLLAHIPLVQLAVPARYSVFVVIGVVVVLAEVLDTLWSWAAGRLRGAAAPWSRRALPTLAVVAVVVVALLPLLPAYPVRSAPVDVPRYFTTSAVESIPLGSNVLFYPYPLAHEDYSMLWQSETGFRFDLLGGYVLRPLQLEAPPYYGQAGGDNPPTLAPPVVQILFYEAAGSTSVKIPPAPWAIEQVELFLRRYRVATIVDDPQPQPVPGPWAAPDLDPAAVTRFFTTMFGAPRHAGALLLWYHADTRRVVAAH